MGQGRFAEGCRRVDVGQEEVAMAT
jgi:hypothetical protein